MLWANAVNDLGNRNIPYVLVTILSIKGSSPRAVQSKMVVIDDRTFDSIGGGKLEFAATQEARQILRQNVPSIGTKNFSLGKDLVQCCGGEVELLFECFPACDFEVVLFGAGHVGSALVKILADLPCRIHWLDSRIEIVESAANQYQDAANVLVESIAAPWQVVENCKAGSFYLVMTHSHEIDFELCEAILGRSDIKFCGLIGSKSKAASFKSRLKRKQFSEQELSRLVSPVGLDLGAGKEPAVVAVAIAAQLLQLYNSTVTSA